MNIIKTDDFKKRVIYQIYPSSFKDSNNDGWGDIQGIISKLDYLRDLGIGIIWLSPIYESPMDDMGYDISNYRKINPLFGTMDDFDQLLLEAKKRDIKIVMDLVINHTSTQHEWFQEAIKDTPNNKYRDYYYIRKNKPNGKAPNNWQAAFSGSAWKEIDTLKGYSYMHLYCDTQADLNYHNENVIKEIEDILRFWLDKGVYGFRCDVINNIYKVSLDDDKTLTFYNKGSKYYANQEGCYKILKRIREEVLDKYDTFLVGETGILNKEIGNKFLNERCLDMFFEFDHIYCDKSKTLPIIKRKFNAKKLIKPIYEWQTNVPWIALYLENHDQLRSISRYGNEEKYYKESGKLLSLLLLTLKGTPFIYQGEEIGILNNKSLTLKETNDISAHMIFDTARKILPLSNNKIEKMINDTLNRDHARSPMQWNDTINGGFNKGNKTWCKVNPTYSLINVEKEEKDSDSILSFYKRMIKIRNSDEVLLKGDFIPGKISKSINTFYREYNGIKYLIVLNFSNKEKKFDTTNFKEIIKNQDLDSNKTIPPYFAGLYQL